MLPYCSASRRAGSVSYGMVRPGRPALSHAGLARMDRCRATELGVNRHSRPWPKLITEGIGQIQDRVREISELKAQF